MAPTIGANVSATLLRQTNAVGVAFGAGARKVRVLYPANDPVAGHVGMEPAEGALVDSPLVPTVTPRAELALCAG